MFILYDSCNDAKSMSSILKYNGLENMLQNETNVQNANHSKSCTIQLPNRNITPSDPDIAAAERTLWSSIDAALSKYSAEVIAIRERKRKR